jgi:hypothetical protein
MSDDVDLDEVRTGAADRGREDTLIKRSVASTGECLDARVVDRRGTLRLVDRRC